MQYWIMKSEPDTFSIDDLKRKNIELWNGIRNYQVRNINKKGGVFCDLRNNSATFYLLISCSGRNNT